MFLLKKLFKGSETATSRPNRSGRRFRHNASFEVTGVDADGQPFSVTAETLDISGEGGCIRIPRNVESRVILTLKNRKKEEYKVQVCWHKFDLEYGKSLVGFKVKGPGDDWALNVVALLGTATSRHSSATSLK
jgi:hypothetical protein